MGLMYGGDFSMILSLSMVRDLYCSGYRMFFCPSLLPRDRGFFFIFPLSHDVASLVPCTLYLESYWALCYSPSLLFCSRDRGAEPMWDFLSFLQLLLLLSSSPAPPVPHGKLSVLSYLPSTFLWVSSVVHETKPESRYQFPLCLWLVVFLYSLSRPYLACSSC